MASGKLNKIILFGKFGRNKIPIEHMLVKSYVKGVWKTDTNVSSKKWMSKAKNISSFIATMNEERKLVGRPTSKGSFVYEVKSFGSNKGSIIPSKLYETKLNGRIPMCCLIRGFKGDGFSLLVTQAKLAQEFVEIGTGKYFSSEEDKYIDQCMVPLILAKTDTGEFEAINVD